VGCGTFRGETVGKARPGRLRSALMHLLVLQNAAAPNAKQEFFINVEFYLYSEGEFWASPPHIRSLLKGSFVVKFEFELNSKALSFLTDKDFLLNLVNKNCFSLGLYAYFQNCII
jgi:hypothetical protein